MTLILDLQLQPFSHAAEVEPAMRPCTGCQRDLPLTDFRRNKAGRFGRTSRCSECLTAKDRAYNATPERVETERARMRTDEYRAWSRARDARRMPEQCEKRRRRRAVIKGATAESFTLLDLASAWDDAGYYACYWCDGSFTDSNPLHVDHLIPLARGGAHAIANLVPACQRCNLVKSAKDPYTFALELHPWLG